MRVKGGHVVALQQGMTLGLDIRMHPALPREGAQFVAGMYVAADQIRRRVAYGSFPGFPTTPARSLPD